MRRSLPAHLLEALEDERDQVESADPLVAAAAMLAVLEGLPWLSATVPARSAWLSCLHEVARELGDACPDAIELGMLVAATRTALAARQTSAGLVAAAQAIARAQELGDAATVVRLRALRLPWLARRAPAVAAAELQAIEDEHGALLAGSQAPDGWLEAEIVLARLAAGVANRDPARLRLELARLARLQLPPKMALASVALASQSTVVQLGLRSAQWPVAMAAIGEALRLCEAEGATAEAANLLATRAAFAVRSEDFAAAHAAACEATAAAARSKVRHTEPDPWLGVPWDISSATDADTAVASTAEAALVAQDLRDAEAFTMAVAAMTAFYLAGGRGSEAVDALTEAEAAATAMGALSARAELHRIASSLTRHLADR